MTQRHNPFKRFLDGFYTPDDAEALFRFFQTPEARPEISRQMEEAWDESEHAVPTGNPPQTYKDEAARLLKRIRQGERRRSFRFVWRYAAAAVLCLAFAYGIYSWVGQQHTAHILYTQVTAGNGEKRAVDLPDGSRVILNAGSTLHYPAAFSDDLRKVEMDGEAFFEVKPDKTKPFVIHTADADVRVLGTSFNVRAYTADEQVAVCVKTGKVEVAVAEGTMRLLPDEEIVLDKASREISKRRESAEKVTVWLKGGLYFNRTPIRSVIHQLERIYNCRIEFAPGRKYNDYLYGEHDNRSLEAVLNSIRYSTGIKHRKEGDIILLYKD